MKKIISIAFVLLVLSIYTTAIHAEEIVDSGNCGADGDNLTWVLDSEGTLTISGEGDMEDWAYYVEQPWYKGHSSIKKIIIDEGVTSIGNSAFWYCSNLIEVEIPLSVTAIGDRSFHGCANLQQVILPENIAKVGKNAFIYCDNIETILIPASVEEIGEYAFSWCMRLENIDVDDNNQNYCDIDGILFSKDKTELLQYPVGKKDTVYTIPDGVTSLANGVFYHATTLTSITIPDGLVSIGDDAFNGCYNIESIKIPDSVTEIGAQAFWGCYWLTTVRLSANILKISRSCFEDCEHLTDIEIPKKVEFIESRAFWNCRDLKQIIIPDKVTEIESEAFARCSSLSNIILSDNIQAIRGNAFVDTAFVGDESNWIKGVLYIGNHLIASSKMADKNYTVRDGTVCIASNAFSYDPIKTIAIPTGIKSIPLDAFHNCRELSAIYLPDTVTSIKHDAFYGCESLTDVYYGGSAESWNNIDININNWDPENDKYLLNASIHYNADGIPVPSITRAIVASSENNYRFDLLLENIPYRCQLITALYDHGTMTEMKVTELSTDNIPDSFTITADSADSAKVFLWDGLENMSPLCEAVDAEFQ